MDIINTSCSSLPLGFICPPSLHVIDLRIDHTGELAGVGTAVHRALAPLIEGIAPATSLEIALDMHRDASWEEVRPLFWSGVKMWEKIREWMPGARAEVGLSATVTDGDYQANLTGHIDLLSVDHEKRSAVVGDWKSGRLDHDFHHQGFGYATLVMLNDHDVDEVSVHFFWLRTGEIESYVVTRDRMNQWLEELMADVVKWDGRYHDGHHCGHCHRNHDCPAVTAMIRRDVAMFSDDAKANIESMDAPTFCGYWRKLKTLEGLVKEAREHSRIEVERRGGEVHDGSGSVIHFVEHNAPREVDYLKAKPVISELLTEDEFAPAIEVSAKKLEDIVGKKAGRGKGSGAKRELAEALVAAGAITQTKQRKLIEERAK
jgi:hypothetical protein